MYINSSRHLQTTQHTQLLYCNIIGRSNMAPTRKSVNLPATSLTPKSIVLCRHGAVSATLCAPVNDSQHFSFTVPRKMMQLTLDTLHVSDSRGSIPSVSFKAPVYISTEDLIFDSEEVWNDIVRDNQGSLVLLELSDGSSVKGHLMGLKSPPAASDTKHPTSHLLLLTDSTVSTHQVDSITSLSFMDCAATEKLARFTSLRSRVIDTQSHYRIQIHAHGSGPGELTVSFDQSSPFSPAYDISYLCTPDKGSSDYGVYPSSLKCFATIRNPLHYDLKDVDVTLDSGFRRQDGSATVYNDRFESQASRQNGGSKSGSESGSSSGSSSGSESEESVTTYGWLQDTATSTGRSTTSWFAHEHNPEMFHKLAEKVSVKVGESVRMFLFEKRVNAGVVHLFDGSWEPKRAMLSMYLANCSDVPLEPGRFWISQEGHKLPPTIIRNYMRVGQRSCAYFVISGCWMTKSDSFKITEMSLCGFADEKMIVKVKRLRTSTYEFHNKEKRNIEVVVDHKCLQSSPGDSELDATLYTDGKEINVAADKYTPLFPRVDYWVRLRPGQKSRLVILEETSKEKKFGMFGNSSSKVNGLITTLEMKKIMNEDMGKRLRKVLGMRREIEQLRRERRVHVKRLEALKGYNRRKAEEDPKEDGEVEYSENGDGYLIATRKCGESIRVIEGRVDGILSKEMELCKLMEENKKEICDLHKLN